MSANAETVNAATTNSAAAKRENDTTGLFMVLSFNGESKTVIIYIYPDWIPPDIAPDRKYPIYLILYYSIELSIFKQKISF
jgi:hypothetical protein